MAECQFPTCRSFAQSNGYCVSHRIYSNVKIEKKYPKAIAPKSVKTKQEDKEYKKFVAEFLAKPENKYCAIQINENCTREATVVNHLKRRGKANKMNPEACEPSCSYCNIEIENQDGWARDHGHLQSKFN